MTDTTPSTRFRRRELLAAGGGLAAGLLVPAWRASAAPAFVRSRPVLTHGVQTGDVTRRTAIVWARADRPSRMVVRARGRRIAGPVLTPDTDLTGKVRLDCLTPGGEVGVEVLLEDLDDASVTSEPLEATFTTAPKDARDISFVWSGDLVGQGWGINPDAGGLRIFRAMADLEPDFFLNSGDTCYADGPLEPTVALPDGTTWTNVVTPEKSKVAETLAEFRGQYAYNMSDEALRAFAARVPQVNQWDDHEVLNNWYPGEVVVDARYTEQRVDVLASRAHRAFFEWLPITPKAQTAGTVHRRLSYGPLLDLFVVDMRTYKDPNDENVHADPHRGLLGAEQLAWLKAGLAGSKATWKVLAIDLPLGLIVPDGDVAQEGVANRDPGAPLGRELQFADLLRDAHAGGVTGVVMLTADVHYTAAHHYDPARGSAGEFTPFWEFVSGPLNAGAFGPYALDPTFGPEAVFVSAPPVQNTGPAGGYQFFGQVAIDAASRQMTVRLRDIDGEVLFEQVLDPG